jgi:hypothetical protein
MKTKGFQSCVSSRYELEMTDLEALVVAAYVFADDYWVPARPGRRPLVSNAELLRSRSRRPRSGSALTGSSSA